MIITTKISMDLQLNQKTPMVNAVQTDSYSRNVEISLFSNRKPFSIPRDAAVVIRYRKADRKGGEYDTLPNNSPAWSAKGNALTIALAPQVLTFPGMVNLSVSIIRNNVKLTTFPLKINVQPIAKAPLIESENYFNITSFLAAPSGAQPGHYLQVAAVDDSGKVTALKTGAPETDEAHILQMVEDYLQDNPPESGVTPALSIGTVETLEPGTDATASITGTAEKPILNLGIPKGADAVSEDAVPDYWTSALVAGAETINNALLNAGYNKSAFLFYSDAHWNYGSQMSPTLLKYLHQHTGMNKTFFGGDIVNDEASDYDTMEYLWQWRNQLKDLPNHHSVVGNHDDGNSTNNLFPEQYVYGYLLAAEETPDLVRGDSGLYYYIDSPGEKTRYLCLDTAYKGLTDAQTTFVKDALKSTPEGWHIVAIAHTWVDSDYSVTPAVPGDINADAAVLLAMFDSYNARSGEYADCGGWVEFCIGGHTHWDYDVTSPNGIPVILVETDSKHVRSGLGFTAGTTTESSVNGIIADYDAHQIHVIRIGRGESRDVEITNYVVSYTNVLPVSLANDGVSVYNADVTPGYKADTRWSQSGQAESTQAGTYLSGWIPVSKGDVIRLKNVDMLSSASTSIVLWSSAIGATSGSSSGTNLVNSNSGVTDDEGNITQFTVIGDYTFMRIQCAGFTAASIVTINELIN